MQVLQRADGDAPARGECPLEVAEQVVGSLGQMGGYLVLGAERDIAKGMKGKLKADEAYLRESITNPSAKVVKGFEKFDTGMPIYAGILNDSQIESLILYIKSLK